MLEHAIAQGAVALQAAPKSMTPSPGPAGHQHGTSHLARGVEGSLGRPPEKGDGGRKTINMHTRWAEMAYNVLDEHANAQRTFALKVGPKSMKPLPGSTQAEVPTIVSAPSDATHLELDTVGSLGRPPEKGTGDHVTTNIHTRWAEVVHKVLEHSVIALNHRGRPPEKGSGRPPEGNHNRSAIVEGQARAPIVMKAAGSKAAAKSRKPLPGHRNSWADIDPSDTSCCSTDLLSSDDCSDLDPGCASEGSMENVSAEVA